ncbi:MAG: endonuclease/exonuclease/phosphatase family protein [Chitinophagaceae bacterium]
MSYNIRLNVASDGENAWDKRKQQVAQLINFFEPDILGCQEVKYEQLLYLKNSLLHGNYVGVARDDGKTEGEFSPIFYNSQKYTKLKEGTFWLSATPQQVSRGWDAACNRVCTYVLLQHKLTKRKFWVANTHLDHEGVVARKQSVELIHKQLQKLSNHFNIPVIITGDFNEQPHEPALQFMLQNYRNARAESLVAPMGNADTWNSFAFNIEPKGCIDYLFLSPNSPWQVRKFATITQSYQLKYPSDHFPVFSILKWKK